LTYGRLLLERGKGAPVRGAAGGARGRGGRQKASGPRVAGCARGPRPEGLRPVCERRRVCEGGPPARLNMYSACQGGSGAARLSGSGGVGVGGGWGALRAASIARRRVRAHRTPRTSKDDGKVGGFGAVRHHGRNHGPPAGAASERATRAPAATSAASTRPRDALMALYRGAGWPTTLETRRDRARRAHSVRVLAFPDRNQSAMTIEALNAAMRQTGDLIGGDLSRGLFRHSQGLRVQPCAGAVYVPVRACMRVCARVRVGLCVRVCV
jgi:hypothetical protein